MTVSRDQRFTRRRPCPVCGGHDQEPRGRDRRCWGFVSDDGAYAHCTREDQAGGIEATDGGTHAHFLGGTCRCGVVHGPAAGDEGGARHNGEGDRQRSARATAATYGYADENGELLFECLRYEPKAFRQRRPDGRGGWIWNLTDARRVLYRLPELLRADVASPVFICEGEKDVDTASKLGLVATCNPMGAGKWRQVKDEAAKVLRGRDVVVIPDKDEAGRAHAAEVASALEGVAASVVVREVPTGKDLTEWVQGGATANDVRGLADHDGSEPRAAAAGLVPEWPPLQPIDESATPVPFPVEAMPAWLASFVSALAETTQTPVDIGGTLTLAVVSACVGGRISVRVRGDYVEPAHTYTLAVAPPADRKSAVHRAVTAPLISWEKEQATARRAEAARSSAERNALEQRLRAAEKKAGALDPATAEGADALERARALAVELDRHAVVRPDRVWADDVTPQKLVGLLSEHGGRMALLSAEGGGLAGLVNGLYSEGVPVLDVLLKGHGGDSLRVDRQGRPPEIIETPALTIAVALQPDALAELLKRRDLRGRGLLARFCYVLPKSRVGMRRAGAPMRAEVRDDYHDGVRALLDRSTWCDELRIVSLSEPALAAWEELEREVEPRLGTGGDLEWMADWAGKVCGLVARLACQLHAAEHSGGSVPDIIAAPTMERAISLGRYYLAHAMSAFDMLGADPVRAGAARLIRHLERERPCEIDERAIKRWLRRGQDTPKNVHAECAMLVEYGYLRPAVSPAESRPGRKPGPRWQVRPFWTETAEEPGSVHSSILSTPVLHQARGQQARTVRL